MSDRSKRRRHAGFGWAACIIVCACGDIEEQERSPIAIASVSASVDGGAVVNGIYMVPYDGEPVTVTLDGTASYDPDGMIAEYIWLDTGICPTQRYAQNDAGQRAMGGEMFDWDNVKPYSGDPKPEAKPTVTLVEGDHRFSLWVRDDSGAVSTPSSVYIGVHRIDQAGEFELESDGGVELVDCEPCASGTQENEVGVCK